MAAGAGLEGFVDWVDPNASNPVEEREDDMSSLATGFAVRMCKQAASAQGKTTLGPKVSSRKRSRWLGPNEEAQKSPIVIAVDSPKRVSDALLALEGASQDASKEACALLEDGVPIEGPPNAVGVVGEALLEIVVGPSFSVRLANADPHRPRLLD